MIADGVYDAFIVEVSEEGDALRLDITIVTGEHKGDVLHVRVTGMSANAIDLLGQPASLIVENGMPRVELERP